MTGAEADLADLTRVFFGAFTNEGGGPPGVDVLYQIFLPQAVITRVSEAGCEVLDLPRFVEPRRKILTDGTLVGFREEETAARTEIFGGIAHRFSTYRKAGVLSGRAFAGRGTKTIQFVKLDGAWRISALAWEDEPPQP